MEKSISTKIVPVIFSLVLAFAVTGYASTPAISTSGVASDALIILATTGNPDPLQGELGGTVTSSEELQKKIGSLLNLEKNEHLAPKALVTPGGETYAMVAPTITKDNYIYVDSMGNAVRMDVGDSEGTHKPFVVKEIVEDGGTPWYKEFWYWIKSKFQ